MKNLEEIGTLRGKCRVPVILFLKFRCQTVRCEATCALKIRGTSHFGNSLELLMGSVHYRLCQLNLIIFSPFLFFFLVFSVLLHSVSILFPIRIIGYQ